MRSTGLEASEKEAVHRRIEQLGGSVSSQLTNLVTYVVMKDGLLSHKYRVSATVGIPVLTVEFLDACEKEARRCSASNIEYTTDEVTAAVRRIAEAMWYQPFTGCRICTTGFEHGIRDEIKRLTMVATRADGYSGADVIARFMSENQLGRFGPLPRVVGGGGTYHGVLTPTCTHLIALAPEGQKYKFAKQWGVQVVTFEWFLRSVMTGYRQDEADFAFATDSKHEQRGSAAKPLKRASSVASGIMEIPPSRSSTADPQPLQRNSSAASRASGWISADGEPPSIKRARRAVGSVDIDFGDSSDSLRLDSTESGSEADLRSQPNPQSRLRARRSLITSGSEAELLPPQPRYSVQSRALSAGERQESTEGQFRAQTLVGRPMRSCSVSDDEPDPFMSNTPARKRSSHDRDHGDRDHDKPRQLTVQSRQCANSQGIGIAGPSFSSSPQLELSARTADDGSANRDNTGTEALPLFAACLFTSWGFSEAAQLVLKRAVEENGGQYTDLTSEDRGSGALSPAQLRQTLIGFSERTARRGTSDAYVVVQLSGHNDAAACEEVAARNPGMHVVTECWVEQCLQEHIRYPDFDQIELQTQELPGLSMGQHALFRPLRPGTAQSVQALSLALSISGYEGMERDHIGKLAQALGVPFSEKFSRKATHLICQPPFKGLKYERALKWNVTVVDSTWLYRLAAARSVENTNGICESPAPHATPASRARTGANGQTLPHSAVNTPLGTTSQQLLGGTPGRTPLDVSLERNLDQAISNHNRRADDDATQLSPLLASHHTAAFGAPGRVLSGVVVALSSRLQHRRAELTGLANHLGCQVQLHFDSKYATHLVHQSARDREHLRECRTAARAGVAIVSPWWLYACRDAQMRVPEAEFPSSFHLERHLKLVATTPTQKQQMLETAVRPVARHTENCAANTTSAAAEPDMAADEFKPAVDLQLAASSPALADTRAIGSMFGKKAARTSRRYRPAQSNAGNAPNSMQIDLTAEDNAAERGESRDAQQPSTLSSRSSSGSHLKHSLGEPTGSAHAKWWLNLGPPRPGHPSQLYSQDALVGQYDDLDSMPNTAAVVADLAASGRGQADVFQPNERPGDAATMQTSPLAAHRTTIVYSEDVAALSERDRLIQKLVGR
ncbi:protein kinase activating protein dpb11 [Coemansia sp. RSA 2705]|nr:protein kinase activating protein dpb11 [Coemansia sp. RSA 2705]